MVKSLIVLFCAVPLIVPASLVSGSQKPEIPVVDAGLGTCSAAFTIRENGKPAYNAKITVRVRSGAFGIRKTELEVGTNNEGKCRVTGLPERSKKPLEFVIRLGELMKRVAMTPSDKCDSTFEIDLASSGDGPEQAPKPQ